MAASENFVIGPFVVDFPDFFKGRPNDAGTLKYGCTVLIPKTAESKAALDLINAQVDAVIAAQWPDEKTRPRKLGRPVNDAADGECTNDGIPRQEKYPAYEGHFYAAASSQYSPGVLVEPGVFGNNTGDRAPVGEFDKGKIRSGCKCFLQVNVYTYDQQKKGVSLGLQNVLIVEEGTALGGGAPDPTAAFGGIGVTKSNPFG